MLIEEVVEIRMNDMALIVLICFISHVFHSLYRIVSNKHKYWETGRKIAKKNNRKCLFYNN